MKKIQFSETDDLVDIRFDNVFKAVFTRDSPASKGALSKLVSALIDYEVSVTTITANEPPVDSLNDRQIRFDINCRAENGDLINVEMSFNPSHLELARLEFYAGQLFTGQVIRGGKKAYGDLKQAYQIAILARERFFQDDTFLHSFEYYDSVNGVAFCGKSRIITVELSKVDKVVEKPVEGMSSKEYWAVFFRYLTNKGKRQKINKILELEEGIAMASEVLMEISKDEIERARLMSELKYELDTQSRLVHAERKGEKKGIKKGEKKIIDLLKSGKSPEEIIRQYGGN